MKLLLPYIITTFLLLFATQSIGQDTVGAASDYIESRVASLEKYTERSERIQQQLLRKLAKKEKRLQHQNKTDSIAQQDTTIVNFDSIAKIEETPKSYKRKDKTIDSLKGIAKYINEQNSKISGTAEKAGIDVPNAQVNELKAKLDKQQYTDKLIQNRIQQLQNQYPNAKGLNNIRKEAIYAQGKMKVWREVADDPDVAEEKALEYLKGIEGMDKYFNDGKMPAFGGLGNNATEADLKRMGFQTKNSVQEGLQKQFGQDLSGIQGQMSEQVQQFQDQYNTGIIGKAKDANNKIKDTKQKINDTKSTVNETKQSLNKLKEPELKLNPEKSKPFWHRLEPRYNFRVVPAASNGLSPALLEMSAGVVYSQTPHFRIGTGISATAGLGKDWRNIRFTADHVGVRLYAERDIIYGFCLQAGYERLWLYRNDTITHSENREGIAALLQPRSGNIAYIGIMKSYRINSKWQGTFMMAYDVLWQRHNGIMSTPWIIRMGFGK